MKELVKITEQEGNQVVNARELHQFLESKQQFSDWIKHRIDEYGFIENEDFEVLHKFMKNPAGGRPSKEYAISMDMAKELSMVERNDKGKEARRYFIAMEKKAKNPSLCLLTPREQIKAERKELISLIRQNLLYGDLANIGRDNGFKREAVRDVMKGKYHNAAIVQALFEKAKERKENAGDKEVQQMILNLKK